VSWPARPWGQVPLVGAAAMRRADGQAGEEYGIEPIQLMEVAGWQVARFVDGYLDGNRGKRIVVVAGSGNNGGDALVAARFLHQRGARVTALVVPSADLNSLTARHTRAVRRLGIPTADWPAALDRGADLLLDGLLGTGVRPPLREPAPAIIEAMNAAGIPIVAIDIPSGMDADGGAGPGVAVRAAATLTLAAPKAGLAGTPGAGRVFVADIGLPAALFGSDRASIEALYRTGDIVELRDQAMPDPGT
jgi:ADP-dependent NAD(P)H-hydrate dehydratase / NAD(P)H-hydrate epimerase